jgi:hypothetical protein
VRVTVCWADAQALKRQLAWRVYLPPLLLLLLLLMSQLLSPKPLLGCLLRGGPSSTHLKCETERFPQHSQVTLFTTAGKDKRGCQTLENERISLPSDERSSSKSVRAEDLPLVQEKDNIVVDWEGPDDPANPKKYALHLAIRILHIQSSLAGHSARSGVQHSLFQCSTSCPRSRPQ